MIPRQTKGPPRQRSLPWPKRFDISLLSFFALIIAICDRVNMAVAAPMIMQEYQWNTAQMGWILSGFFWGYTSFMIPVGVLADRLGPRRVFAASIAWWSAFTALTPFPRSLISLALVRSIVGIGESGTHPSINSILVRWFPRQEYSRVAAFCWSGALGGPIIAFPLATAILHSYGWQTIFYVFAILGGIWLPFWLLGTSDKPEDFKSVSETELAYIVESRPQVQRAMKVPWRRILRLPPFWAYLTLHFSGNWFFYLLITWLPTYLLTERHFSLENMAFGSTLPFVSALLGSNLWGYLIDRASRGRDRTRVCKLFLIPCFGAAGTIFMLPFIYSPWMTILVLCLSMGLLMSSTSVYASGSMELAPRYAGTVVGMQNCVANFAGILAPIVVGYLVKANGWSMAFWLASLVEITGVLVFMVFGKAARLID